MDHHEKRNMARKLAINSINIWRALTDIISAENVIGV